MRTIKIVIIFLLVLIISIPAQAFHFKVVSMNTTPGDDYIELGLYDTFGGYAGYNVNDPRNFTRNLRDFLPGAMVAGSFADDEEPILHYITGKKPDGTSGHYKLAIYGQRLAIYGVKGVIKEQSNKTGDEFVFYIKGLIDIGQIRYVQIDYAPNKPAIITQIATSSDLIEDITTAHKLNLIGNSQYTDKLVKRVMQVALLKGDQKKGYEDILSELTSLYSKPEQDRFIKKEGYDVLKEDLDYIISHL